jgi:hypothetical protein
MRIVLAFVFAEDVIMKRMRMGKRSSLAFIPSSHRVGELTFSSLMKARDRFLIDP